MVLTVFAGIAEFERELIQEHTRSGRVAAKARGVRFGRPPKLTSDYPRASVPAMLLRASGEGSGTAGLSTAPDSPDFR